MAKLVSKTVRLPHDVWDALAELASDTERSVNYVMIQAAKTHVSKAVPGVSKAVPGVGKAVPGVGKAVPGVGKAVPGVGKAVPGVGNVIPERYQSGITVIPNHREDTRAGADSSSLSLFPEEEEEGVKSAATLLVELDWRGAALPKSTDPEIFARSLIAAFPAVDIPEAIRRAHVHQLSEAKPKVTLGRFLTNWMDNEMNPPAWKAKKMAAAKEQERSTEQLWDTKKEQPHERRARLERDANGEN